MTKKEKGTKVIVCGERTKDGGVFFKVTGVPKNVLQFLGNVDESTIYESTTWTGKFYKKIDISPRITGLAQDYIRAKYSEDVRVVDDVGDSSAGGCYVNIGILRAVGGKCTIPPTCTVISTEDIEAQCKYLAEVVGVVHRTLCVPYSVEVKTKLV